MLRYVRLYALIHQDCGFMSSQGLCVCNNIHIAIIYIYMYACMCVYVYIYASIYYLCMCVCMYICKYILFMYVCVYVRMYVRTCALDSRYLMILWNSVFNHQDTINLPLALTLSRKKLRILPLCSLAEIYRRFGRT